MKILFVATVPEHFFYFHTPVFELLSARGWEVHAFSSGERSLAGCSRQFTAPISRSPLSRGNLRAYGALKKLIAENDYDVIHCHTPMGGALARLAARKARKRGTRVMYTAHGFHFYKGAPPLGWLVYFPAEYALSRLTDELVTVNHEDYARAKKMRAKSVRLIHGAGYDTARFHSTDGATRRVLRERYGYGADEKLLIYTAELNKNKNQAMLIRAASRLRERGVNARLLLAGTDNFGGTYQKLARELGVAVDFLGERADVPELLAMCDVYVASSLREGLPVNVMEAMAAGLPVVAADNRGHRALVSDGETGFLVPPNDDEAMAERVAQLLSDGELYSRVAENAARAVVMFGRENVLRELEGIYES